MKLRIGFVIGFGVGFYLGAMSGRERYEQINRLVGKVKHSDAFGTAADKAKAAVDLGKERARDVVDRGNGAKVDPPVRP
jgi:hypothetical protein